MSVLTAEEKKEYSLGFKAKKKQKDDLQKWATLFHSVQDSGGVGVGWRRPTLGSTISRNRRHRENSAEYGIRVKRQTYEQMSQSIILIL
jgi:hypothetical protein